MSKDTIFIQSNSSNKSKAVAKNLEEILLKRGYRIVPEFSDEVELIVFIGGDGTFLKYMHSLGFPSTPVIGVNTGHLGFFQEITPNHLEKFLDDYEAGICVTQTIKPLECDFISDDGRHSLLGINEVLIRGPLSHLIHFKIKIKDTLIQDFSGDGILVCTPVGSTAYNYSLGGSLVAPDLDVLQLTPIAPMNTNAYRSFRSSILFPATETIQLLISERNKKDTLIFSYDGLMEEVNGLKKLTIQQSDKVINLLRMNNYDYWAKLTTKLL